MSSKESEQAQNGASESSIQDAAYVEQALGGDESAYKKLMQKYERPLYFFVQKMIKNRDIIPDLLQEIFMKAFNNLSTYNTNYAFSTWLYRIATNHSIDYLRKKKLQTFSIDQPVSTKDGEMQIELPDNSFEADQEVIQKQRKKIVEEAIENLPEKYKAVIQMRHMEEKSYQEIAEILDLPLGTVKAHIFRARELLYKYLKEKKGTF
jgi:RNA polymerase sigma-70 factor (ECF subfamily)